VGDFVKIFNKIALFFIKLPRSAAAAAYFCPYSRFLWPPAQLFSSILALVYSSFLVHSSYPAYFSFTAPLRSSNAAHFAAHTGTAFFAAPMHSSFLPHGAAARIDRPLYLGTTLPRYYFTILPLYHFTLLKY
jgi:hypothetical protein